MIDVIHELLSLGTHRTKRMVVDVLKVQPGDNLTEILYTPATPEQVCTPMAWVTVPLLLSIVFCFL